MSSHFVTAFKNLYESRLLEVALIAFRAAALAYDGCMYTSMICGQVGTFIGRGMEWNDQDQVGPDRDLPT